MATLPRLLLVSHGLPPARVGGAELVTWRIARLLARAGVPVAAFHPEVGGAATPGELVRSETRQVVRYTFGAEPDVETSSRAPRAFSRALTLWRPDAVWFHHLSGLSMGVPDVALAEGLPTAVTFHDYGWMCARGQLVDGHGERCAGPRGDRCPRCLAPGAPLPLRPVVGLATRRWWADRDARARAILGRAARRTAPSAHVARRFEDWLGAGHGVEVLPNPSAPLARIPLPPASGPLKVGFFGTILPTKGVEILLEAQLALPPDRIAVQLHGPLPGGDRWRDWRQRVRSLAARSGATLAGPYAPADIGPRMGEVEVLCLPSTWEENAPVVLQEARLAGRVVVASDVGGVAEFVSHPAAVVLVPPGDVGALARTLGDVARLRHMGQVLHEAPPAERGDDEPLVRFVERLARR